MIWTTRIREQESSSACLQLQILPFFGSGDKSEIRRKSFGVAGYPLPEYSSLNLKTLLITTPGISVVFLYCFSYKIKLYVK
jgi:hypothetical protein